MSDVTSALEVAALVVFVGGLLSGSVLGFVAGARWAGRRKGRRWDRCVDEALAAAAPDYRPAASLDAWEAGQARRLLDEAFGDQREEAG